MKNLLFGLFLGILAAFAPQTGTRSEPERIVVGSATLQLGMDKDAAISKLAESGYKLSKVQGSEGPGETWGVMEQTGGEYHMVSLLEFTNGRLTWADRTLAGSSDAGSAKIGRAVYLLARSFEESGRTACSIETKSSESLEYETKGTYIHCGRRTIFIHVSRNQEQPAGTSVNEIVSETVK